MNSYINISNTNYAWNSGESGNMAWSRNSECDSKAGCARGWAREAESAKIQGRRSKSGLRRVMVSPWPQASNDSSLAEPSSGRESALQVHRNESLVFTARQSRELCKLSASRQLPFVQQKGYWLSQRCRLLITHVTLAPIIYGLDMLFTKT